MWLAQSFLSQVCLFSSSNLRPHFYSSNHILEERYSIAIVFYCMWETVLTNFSFLSDSFVLFWVFFSWPWPASSLDSSIISLDDISELSGDSPEPKDLDNTNVLPSARTQMEKEELLPTEVIEIRDKEGHKKGEKKRKRKGKKNRQRHKGRRREKLPVPRTGDEEGDVQYESDEDDGSFRIPAHFPIPVPPIEAPPLPSGCSTSDSTVSCINAKLTQIPPISDPDLTSLDLTGN